MLGDVVQIVLNYDVYDVALIFDEDIPLKLRLIFDSKTSEDLSCNREMEDIISCKQSLIRPFFISFYWL